MTDSERDSIMAAMHLRLRELERQVAGLASSHLSMNRRLQLQEAGTALYEVEHVDRSMQ